MPTGYPTIPEIVVLSVSLTLIVAGFLFSSILIIQSRARKKQLNLYDDLVRIQEAERVRIGRDLHDQTSPFLSAIQYHLDENPGSLDYEITTLLRNSIQSVRSASHNLSPPGLLENGIAFSIKSLIKHAFSQTGIIIITEINPEQIDISDNQSIQLYRIIAELLANAVKYSQAETIKIEVSQKATGLKVLVSDDGIGMDKENAIYSDGLGWQSINSRIALMKATCEVNSTCKGTQVDIFIPNTKL